MEKQKIRCAIYTRKSREDGLEQEFNSLHAQRASAENYIASQEHEGWTCSSKSYDDGGFSGGTIERPALAELFSDIKQRKVDVIVVYKIDRLTRSLLDFAKIVEFLNEYNVAFVSVTEHFNSSTSTGRLMLNMLLSFAQYERELTSERIRDKFAASSRQGIWMGGNPPLGYDAKNRKLLVNEEEAKLVKYIYGYFLETGSVSELVKDLNAKGKKTKSWITQAGKLHPGRKFCKTSIRRILENPVYAGKIKYKDKVYGGQHQAIVSDDSWEKVQKKFQSNKYTRTVKPTKRITEPPLLRGCFECQTCEKSMTPTYTKKKGRRYRYYICSGSNQGSSVQCQTGRIPAKEIEEIVIEHVIEALKTPEIVARTITASKGSIEAVDIIERFKSIHNVWDELFPVEQSRIINLLIQKVYISDEGVDIRIHSKGLSSLSQEIGAF